MKRPATALAGRLAGDSGLRGLATPLGRWLWRLAAIADPAERQRRLAEVKQLTLPSEMGERFQVMGFSRDVEFGPAFLVGDLVWRL